MTVEKETVIAIKIDRDYQSAGDRFRVLTQDKGFGRGKSERGLSLDQALELVRHYYMVPEHVRTNCQWCDKKRNAR